MGGERKRTIIIGILVAILLLSWGCMGIWYLSRMMGNKNPGADQNKSASNEQNSNSDDSGGDNSPSAPEPEETDEPTLTYKLIEYRSSGMFGDDLYDVSFSVPEYAGNTIETKQINGKESVEVSGEGFMLQLIPAYEASMVDSSRAATAAKIDTKRLEPGTDYFRFKRVGFGSDASKDYYTYSDTYVDGAGDCGTGTTENFCFSNVVSYKAAGEDRMGALTVVCAVDKGSSAYKECDKILLDLEVKSDFVGGE